MQDNNLQPITNVSPLVEKLAKDSLKIYAVVSKHKDLPEDIFEGKKLLLSLSAAPRLEMVIEGIRRAIANQGGDPSSYILLRLVLERTLPELLPYAQFHFSNLTRELLTEIPPVAPASQEKTKQQKSKEELVSYVRYIFGKSATDEEKIVAENVIKKFQENGKV